MLTTNDSTCSQCNGEFRPSAAVVSTRTLFVELLSASFSVRAHLRPNGALPDVVGPDNVPSAALTDVQLVVIDAEVSPDNDFVHAVCFQATRQALPILVVGGDGDRIVEASWIERGASAFIENNATIASIREVVNQLSRGQTIIGVAIRESLLQELRATRTRNQERFAAFDALTKREEDVLRHLTNGTSPEEIARISYVSVNTVRTQIRGILAKLHVTSVVAAVAMAYRTGWLEVDGVV